MIKVKKKRIRCYEHTAKDRPWHDYVLWPTDYNGVELYRCKICEEKLKKEIERDERVRANEKRQREEADRIYSLKSNKRNKERQRSIREDIWDFVVKDELAKGIKLKGHDKYKYKYKESLPRELLQLTRATMKLNRLLKSISKLDTNQLYKYPVCRIHRTISDNVIWINEKTYKCGLCAKNIEKIIHDDKQVKEFQEHLKTNQNLTQSMRDALDLPIMNCKKHGELYFKAVIKAGMQAGEQRYKCRQCMKKLHQNNYKNNKEEILKKQKEYRLNNPERIKEIKAKSWRKCNVKNNKHDHVTK